MSKHMRELKKPTALVVVASTRASQGIYPDTSGPIAVNWLRQMGFSTPEAVIVADREIPEYFAGIFAQELPTVIMTSGGTGISPDDLTVEAIRPYLDKEIPGIMHALWNHAMHAIPRAVLSRGVAGVVGKTFVVTLPGSTGGVKDGCAVLTPLIEHICHQLQENHDH